MEETKPHVVIWAKKKSQIIFQTQKIPNNLPISTFLSDPCF